MTKSKTKPAATNHDNDASLQEAWDVSQPSSPDTDDIEDILEAASNHCFPDDGDGGTVAEDEAETEAKPPNSSREFIAGWIVDKRISEALKPIRQKIPFCLLIEVPEQTWSEPLGEIIGKLVGRLGLSRHMSDLVITTDDLPKRDNFDRLRERCINILSSGNPLVIVVPQPRTSLPPDLLTIADNHIVLAPITSMEIVAIIEDMTHSSFPHGNECLGAGMSFDQLCAAIRLGDKPGAILDRLRKFKGDNTSSPSISAPTLEGLEGYGDAKSWGLRLAREIDRYRAGVISLEDLPRGLMLSGPPGCGKTLFSQALARTCDVPLIPTSVAAWLQAGDGHLGDVMLEVKRVFSEAHKKPKPAILFIDECDAFVDPSKARDRSNWWNTLRAGVLSAIDGVATEPGLIILGACNHPDDVDAALKRSGRMDRHVRIKLPDADALAKMLSSAFATDLPDVDFSRYASALIGSTGADIARFVREIHAQARDHDRAVTLDDVEAVLLPTDNRPPHLTHRIAVHEAGHAVVAMSFGRTLFALRLDTGNAEIGGYAVASRPPIFTPHTLAEEVMVMLAGRAAEIVVGLEPSSGAGADLAAATHLVTQYHAVFGFGSAMSGFGDDVDTKELLARFPRLSRQVDADLSRYWSQALAIVRECAADIEVVAQALIRQRHLDEAEVWSLLDETEIVDDERRPA